MLTGPLLTLAFAASSTATLVTVAPTPSGVVVLQPISLADFEGTTPSAKVVDTIAARLHDAAGRSRLQQLAFAYSSATQIHVDPKEMLRAINDRPLPADIKALLDGAAKAKQDFDDDKRIELLKRAVQEMSQRLIEIGQTNSLIAAELDLAGAYLGGAYPMFAEPEFARVVTLRPSTELDLRRFPPQAVTVFHAVKQSTLALPRGSINVNVKPEGALIVVNGLTVGTSPKVVEVLGGTHLVQLRAEGYNGDDRLLQIEAGAETPLQLSLARLPAMQAADDLLAALRTEDHRAAALSLARDLAKTLGASGIVVTGVAPVPGGYALVATLAAEPPRTVVGTFSASLDDAAAICAAVLDRLAIKPTTADSGPELVSVAEPALPLKGVPFDLDKRLLGGRFGPLGAVRPTPGGVGGPFAAGSAGELEALEPASWHNSWWFWTLTGVVAVGAASAGAWAYSQAANRERFPGTDLGRLQINP